MKTKIASTYTRKSRRGKGSDYFFVLTNEDGTSAGELGFTEDIVIEKLCHVNIGDTLLLYVSEANMNTRIIRIERRSKLVTTLMLEKDLFVKNTVLP